MKEFQHRNTVRKMIYSKITMIILALFCILMLRSVVELYRKYEKVHALKVESDMDLQKLEDKVSKSEQKNKALQTDRGMEEYIRSTYPVVKPGEGVIVVYDASSSPVVPVRKDIPLSEKIKLFFVQFFTTQ